MSVQRRGFHGLAIFAAASAIPAWGQDLTPTIGPAGSGAQSASPIPDFSGIWSHPYIPNFEPPRSGPGPVLNRARMRQAFGDDRSPLPGTSNLLVGNPARLVGDYTNPILKPEAAEIVKKRGEISLSGAADPTPYNQCGPAVVPYIFKNLGMQMLHQPRKIHILFP